MNKKNPVTNSPSNPKPDRPVIQLLAFALVCLFLITFFGVMALVNLKSVEASLLRLIENKGLIIIRNIEQDIRIYFEQLKHALPPVVESPADHAMGGQTATVQEAFVLELTDLAQEVDALEGKGHLDPERFAAVAVEESIWLIVFLDGKGQIILQNLQVPGKILQDAAPVIKGFKDFMFLGFTATGEQDEFALVAIRRASGRGTILLALNNESLKNRKALYAARRAIDEMIPDPDVAYVIFSDAHGNPLAQSGGLSGKMDKVGKIPPAAEYGAAYATRLLVKGKQRILEMTAPVVYPDEFSGVIRLGVNTRMSDRILNENKRNIFLFSALMVLLTCLTMWALYKNQNRYLSRMQDMERQVQRAQRLSALGSLASGVAHEIRNPLNAISMAIQRLQKDKPHPLTGVIRDEINRLDHIVDEFLSISGGRKLSFRRYDLKPLLKEITLLVQEEARSRKIHIDTRLPESSCMMLMDTDKMKQVILNLIKNAMDAIKGGGKIELAVELKDRKWLQLKVADSGAGLDSGELSRIFELDYTTKDRGLGLGLPMVHEIVRGHGGDIRVESQPGKGTTFIIRLPAGNP